AGDRRPARPRARQRGTGRGPLTVQKLAEICIARPVFAAMLILAMTVAGLVGFSHLAVDRYPSFDQPTVSVRTELPGAAPEEVEVTVAQPIEEAVNTVAGITELRSICGT